MHHFKVRCNLASLETQTFATSADYEVWKLEDLYVRPTFEPYHLLSPVQAWQPRDNGIHETDCLVAVTKHSVRAEHERSRWHPVGGLSAT